MPVPAAWVKSRVEEEISGGSVCHLWYWEETPGGRWMRTAVPGIYGRMKGDTSIAIFIVYTWA